VIGQNSQLQFIFLYISIRYLYEMHMRMFLKIILQLQWTAPSWSASSPSDA
jgi:hypothetical protein